MSAFNYISTLRTNCGEDCEQEICPPYEPPPEVGCCEALATCTACPETDSGWKGAIVTISGVPADGEDCHWNGSEFDQQYDCDDLNNTYTMCGLFLVNTTGFGAAICSTLFGTSRPAGYIGCLGESGSPWEFSVFAGMTCTSEERVIFVQAVSAGVPGGLWMVREPIDGPHPVWDDLCAGEEVELPAIASSIYACKTGPDDGSTATIQLTCDDTDCVTIIGEDTCENMANCLEAVDIPLWVSITGFQDHTSSGTDDIGIYSADWPFTNLNGNYEFRLAEITDPLGSGWVSSDPWWYYCPLGTPGDHDDPGILFGAKDYSDDPDDPTWQREYYVYGIYLSFGCSLSSTEITGCVFLLQRFWGYTPGTYPWIWPSFETSTTATFSTPIDSGSGSAHGCLTSDMWASFVDDFFGVSFSDNFVIQAWTGPLV